MCLLHVVDQIDPNPVWLCFILMELCLYCRYFKCMSFVVLKVLSAVLIAVGIYAKVAKESGI